MGMFDSVLVDYDLLPISNREKQLLKDDWQSKSLSCNLGLISVKKEGVFYYKRKVNINRKVDIKPNSVKKDVRIYYSGILNIYTEDANDKWYEFNVIILNGIPICTIQIE